MEFAVCQSILSACAAAPGAIAVSGRYRNERVDVSYAQFMSMVDELCSIVLQRDDRPSALGILGTRSLETYVAVVAALFLEIRFVPLNPKFANARLKTIMDAAGVDLVLHETPFSPRCQGAAPAGIDLGTLDLPDEHTALERPRNLSVGSARRNDEIAYHMFTSGSTGTPKGVPISRRNLDAYLNGVIEALPFERGRRFSQFFDLSFDLALHDILVCLATGGTLVPASDMDLFTPHLYVARNKIDVWFSVPMLAFTASKGAAKSPPGHKISLALFCGEALPFAYVEKFRALTSNDGRIFNLYGPTEATIAISRLEISDLISSTGTAPLGQPLGRNVLAIEDAIGIIHELPAEPVEGELLLAGPQVFSGYNPDVGETAFVQFGGLRFYRSGDLVRYDGAEMHHLGRNDSQVKIRGFRVELGEVERVFAQAFECDAVAAVDIVRSGNKEILLAYVGAAEVASLTPLAELLPVYMMPAQILRLDEMPLNDNGKIKRAQLRELAK